MTGLNVPSWPGGRTTAVSLTYDDCLPVHRQLVAPLLDSRGITATFYVPVGAADLQENADEWRAVAAAGHELGNHSMFHPCRTDVRPEARDWLPAEYDLANYTRRRWRDEMASANFVLGLIDGGTGEHSGILAMKPKSDRASSGFLWNLSLPSCSSLGAGP